MKHGEEWPITTATCGICGQPLPCGCRAHVQTPKERIAELEAKLAQAVTDRDEWKNAVLDAAVVDWVYTAEHETNPRKAVNDLLAWESKVSLDPRVSKEAHDLYERLERVEAALRAVEWVKISRYVIFGNSALVCPWCGANQSADGGHFPDCQRQAALAGPAAESGKLTRSNRTEVISGGGIWEREERPLIGPAAESGKGEG